MSEAIKIKIKWLDSHGCTNHGCNVRHTPLTVGTNATCSCLRRLAPHEIEQVVWFKDAISKHRIEALKAEQDKIKTAISLWLDGHQSATRVLYQIRDILGVK